MAEPNNEEIHFLNLFTGILNAIISEKNLSDTDIGYCITDLRRSFLPPATFHYNNFTDWDYICGYLYRYGSHGAGFARSRILTAIQNCENVQNTLKKPDLKVLCLGSGPGNDAMGFCSALSELQSPKSLKLTLVDRFEEWRLCIELAERFIAEQDFGKVSNLFNNSNVEVSFIKVDLPGDSKSPGDSESVNYFKALREADVIIISKFLSYLEPSSTNELETAIIQSLFNNTKEDVLILLCDTCYIERWCGFRRLYWRSNREFSYQSTALASPRFNNTDGVTSSLGIHVLVKQVPGN